MATAALPLATNYNFATINKTHPLLSSFQSKPKPVASCQRTPMRLCQASKPLPGSLEAKYPSRESSDASAAAPLEPPQPVWSNNELGPVMDQLLIPSLCAVTGEGTEEKKKEHFVACTTEKNSQKEKKRPRKRFFVATQNSYASPIPHDVVLFVQCEPLQRPLNMLLNHSSSESESSLVSASGGDCADPGKPGAAGSDPSPPSLYICLRAVSCAILASCS